MMETYHKIQTLFKRDLDGSITGKKGKMLEGAWTTPELQFLADNQWEFTEKVDGTNTRIGFHQDGEVIKFAGRSDNATIPAPLLRHLEETFTPELFESAGITESTILYGEGYGPKIQGGGKYRADHSFVLFDVKIGPWWLHRQDVEDIAKKLGIDSVPVIGRGTLYEGINMVKGNRMYLRAGNRAMVREGVGLQSLWGDFEAEGIVCRPRVPMFDRKGNRIICKVKAVDFK